MAIGTDGGAAVCSGGGEKRKVDELGDRCEAVDRISVLPDELQQHMLTHLPLKDAIRTGTLARGWRDLWKDRWAHRTSLKVYLCSRDDLRRELNALAHEPRPRRRLERFSLTVSTSYLKSSEFQRFLDYATECGIEDLHVETCRATAKAKLRFHLPLSSPAVACLSLNGITVSMFFFRRSYWSFHALEVIRLVSVSLCNEALAKMMALCPSLRTLDLRCCSYDGWEFYSLLPNLNSLTIADCGRINMDFMWVPPTLRSFCYYDSFSNFPLSIPRNGVLFDIYIQLDESVD